MITLNRTAIMVMPGGVPVWWPFRRESDAFDRWLEWRFHFLVVDIFDDPLLQEEI